MLNLSLISLCLCFLIFICGTYGKCPTTSSPVQLPSPSQFDVTIMLNIHGAKVENMFSQTGISLMASDGVAIEANNVLFGVNKLCLDIENGNEVEFIYFNNNLKEPMGNEKVKTTSTDSEVCSKEAPNADLRALQIKVRDTENSMGPGSSIIVKNLSAKLCLQDQ